MSPGVRLRIARWSALIEIALIGLWAVFAGRLFLNFAPNTWLFGSDYPLQILDYYVWRLLPACGTCVFWNGFVSGGWPAFADYFGGHLHPLVILNVLIFGPVQATKVIVVASMALAGIGQWWLARAMGLGRTARLWVGGLAVVGGHLLGRMDMGLIIMVLSIATASLVLAPLVEFSQTGRRRPAIWLGVMAGLTMISGQGYIQLGVLMALVPAALILFWGKPLRSAAARWNLLLAGGLAGLISAVNLVPLARFWGNISKAGDPYFAGAQPIPFIPLNMLIADYAFYTTDALQKKPFPAFYMNYIGWVPVLLALLTIIWVPKAARRVWFFFMGAILLVYVVSSGILFRILVSELPFLSGARHPALISSLSVPLVLGLAAWGLDLLIARLNLPRLNVGHNANSQTALVPYVLLGGVLVFSVYSVYNFSQRWKAVPVSTERLAAAAAVRKVLNPGTAQWVQYPTGDLALAAVLVEDGYKVNIDSGHRNASWKGRELPPAYITFEKGVAVEPTPGTVGAVGDYVSLVMQPENQYARVFSMAGDTPCQARSQGGTIDVTCRNETAGQLVVYENMYPGWKAWRDGTAVNLLSTEWLAVDAPAGMHVYEFRYLPWDAIVGAIMSLLGWGLAFGLAFLLEAGRHGEVEEVFASQTDGQAEAVESMEEGPPLSGEPVPETVHDEPGEAAAAAASVHIQTATYPAVSGFVHVDVELELPAGAESVIDITCEPDGRLEIREE